MRKELFEENYRLLDELVGDLLIDGSPKYFLLREAGRVTKDTVFVQYGVTAERTGENIVNVATFYYKDKGMHFVSKGEGHLITDPALTILFNKKLKIARLKTFYNNNPMAVALEGINPPQFVSACTYSSKEKDDEEREMNDYLNEFLTDLVEKKRRIEKEGEEYLPKIYYNSDYIPLDMQ